MRRALQAGELASGRADSLIWAVGTSSEFVTDGAANVCEEGSTRLGPDKVHVVQAHPLAGAAWFKVWPNGGADTIPPVVTGQKRNRARCAIGGYAEHARDIGEAWHETVASGFRIVRSRWELQRTWESNGSTFQ